MSGPTLGLNITGTGQAKIEATISAIDRLAAALRTLPAAAAEIDKINKALNKAPAGPSGLKGGAADLKELVGEFKNLGAQLNTSFASLEETIKKGWAKAQKANAEGEASVKSSGKAKKALTFTSVGTNGQPVEVDAGWFAKLQTGAEKFQVTQALAAQKEAAAIEAAAAKKAAAQEKADAVLRAAFDKKYAKEADWLQKLKNESAKMAEAQREAAEREAAAAALAAQRREATIQVADARLRAAYDKANEAEAARIQALKLNSAKMAEAQREAAEREAAAAALAAQRKAALEEARIQALKLNSAKMAEAQREAAEREAAAISAAAAKLAAAQRATDARYAEATPAQKARTVLGARALLDQPGATPSEAAGKFGGAAAAAAEQTTFANAMQKVHGEIEHGVPKLEGYNRALKDLHNGLRGVASGFGQMALTWSAIGPLLAGAAIGQSFVQSIKIGASVRQDLEELRVLSEESQGAVSGLEKQLISLGQTGPFGPREVADAMKTLSLAGLDAQQVGQALKPALDFAITGGVTIQKSSESLVAIGTAYGYQASEFGLVADAVAKAAAISMSSVSGMMESFKASSVVAQAYGVSLKDTATTLAMLANIGIRGSAAGTAMRQMYAEISGATGSTRKAMKDLGVSVVEEGGKMRPVIDIFLDLSKALDKYKGKAQIAAIQAISNNRGEKSVVADLVGIRTPAKAQIDPNVAAVAPRGIRAEMEAIEAQAKRMGQSATSELERIRQLIEESAGFNAIAASELASTPENLMKGVVASLQTSLFEAFKALEPTLIVAATQMRDVFNSQGFRDGITTLVQLMGAFTAAVIDNIGWLKYLAIGFAAFKGLQIFQLALSATAVVLGIVSKELVVTSGGIMAAGAASAAATPALTGMALAARGLSVALAIAGPLALVLTAAAFAWQLYGQYKRDANADAAQDRQANTLESLRKEKERLTAVAGEMSKGTEARLAEVRAMDAQAAAQRRLDYDKGRSPYIDRLTDLRGLKDKYVKEGRTGQIGEVDRQIAGAEQNLGYYDQSFGRSEKAIASERIQVQALSNGLDILRQARQRSGPTEGKNGNDQEDAVAIGNSKLDLLKKQYTREDQESQTAYRREMELLDIRYKGKLVSEAEYSTRSEELSSELYKRDITNLERYVTESARLITLLQSDPKKATKSKGVIAEIEAERAEKLAQLNFLQSKNVAQQDARANTQGLQLKAGLDKLRETVALQEEKYAADLRTLGMTPGMIAAEQAMADVRSKGAAAMRKTVEIYVQAQQELNKLESAPVPDLDTDADAYLARQARIATLQKQLADLRKSLNAGAQTVETQAGKSGAAAKGSTDFGNAAWRKWMEEGLNAVTVLEGARNEFMNGWISQGQTMWEAWLKTGKVSWKALGDLAIKTIADISYKQGIGQVFAKAGEGLFNRVAPLVQGNVSNETRKDIDVLKQSSDELGQSMTKLGGSFWQLLQEAGQGFATMFQEAGGSSGGFLSSLLKGGGGGGKDSYQESDGSGGFTTVDVTNARGNAFSAQGLIHAFAKGGLPTNSVIDQPHYFRFGGSKLGVAGEAGPEAIMPLTRGSDGTLGVRAQGVGGGSGSVSVVSKTTVVIENHGGGPEPVVQQQKQPNGDELIRVVIGAAAKDINRGGDLRKSVQGVQGRSNLPRY
jgi:TP901 family phage tail tape measure protein